jgi:hypothetical protein
MMKTTACLLVLLAAGFTCRASDISDLASGYASAFKNFEHSSISITYSTDGQTEVLKNVKKIEPFGGALLIRFENGEQMIISAAGVTRMAR